MQGLFTPIPFYGTTFLRHASDAYLAMEDHRLLLARERFSPRIERFYTFLDRIGEASGQNVRAMLSPEEWAVVERNLREGT